MRRHLEIPRYIFNDLVTSIETKLLFTYSKGPEFQTFLSSLCASTLVIKRHVLRSRESEVGAFQ